MSDHILGNETTASVQVPIGNRRICFPLSQVHDCNPSQIITCPRSLSMSEDPGKTVATHLRRQSVDGQVRINAFFRLLEYLLFSLLEAIHLFGFCFFLLLLYHTHFFSQCSTTWFTSPPIRFTSCATTRLCARLFPTAR